MSALYFDDRGVASLDGQWDFFPGATGLDELDQRAPHQIRVPALWEAEGWLELDGEVWYRRRFELDDVVGWWTMQFGAVMDIADVWVNGAHVGGHDNAFTPFALDVTGRLVIGENTVAVRVVDPPVTDPEHIRLAHGKQGWANHVFPSRPSLYMTYGGIWQPVMLRRHGPVVVRSVFVNSDPDDLCVRVTLANCSDRAARGRLAVRGVSRLIEEHVEIAPGAEHVVNAMLGPTNAARWSPESPVLHEVLVDVVVNHTVSDRRVTRFGLRTVRVDGTRIRINDRPYRMKSALVQGFRSEELYAEGSRAAIEYEVRAARAAGFNTLRLHIKAFDPTYLDVCDELGMLLHCDIPVAEPIAHEEMGEREESLTAKRAVEAVEQQVVRDRNHPSVILWSVMNELTLDRIEARDWPNYERFARALVAAAKDRDPTRPVIENDWVEPDPARVYAGDVLTAHWYGRLHAEYLAKLEKACVDSRTVGRPLYVTEFGDWGLPQMPSMPDPPFWDTRAIYAADLAQTQWPATVGRFITETQRYQGLSDRLQAEVFRRHEHIGGYCVTELTDVPHELNGLLDLHRRPKALALAEIRRMNQPVLPILTLDSLVVIADEELHASLCVANDGGELRAVDIDVRFGDAASPLTGDGELRPETLAATRDAEQPENAWTTHVDALAAYAVTDIGPVALRAPTVPGAHDLVVRAWQGNQLFTENRYPVHVVKAPAIAGVAVRCLGGTDAFADALRRLGAEPHDAGLTVIAEGALTDETAAEVRACVERGEVVVVLAQAPDAAGFYPMPVELRDVATEWASSVFHFTTDNGALACLPRRNLLVAEDSTVQARSMFTAVAGATFPDTPVVIAYKPPPFALTGTVVGSHGVGPGRVVVCQYRLARGVEAGDGAASALLADVLSWASGTRPALVSEREELADGRATMRFHHELVVAR